MCCTSDAMYIVCNGEVQTHFGDRGTPIVTRPGFVVGESDFFLSQPRSTRVKISKDGTQLYELTSESLRAIEASEPALYATYQKFLIRILARQVSWATSFQHSERLRQVVSHAR